MKPGRSVSSRKRSSSTLKLMPLALSSSSVTANIFVPTENTRSAPHLVSSVAPGKVRHRALACLIFMRCCPLSSSQPAFAAAVKLHVAEALAAGAGNAEVELLDVFVAGQFGGRAFHHHAAVLQDVAEVRVAQRDAGVLLGQQEGDVLLAVQVLDDAEDLVDDLRRDAHRW